MGHSAGRPWNRGMKRTWLDKKMLLSPEAGEAMAQVGTIKAALRLL